MGTPVRKYVKGADCFAWSDPTNTPRKCYAFFWEIKKGDRFGAFQPKNNFIWTLWNNPLTPCVWNSIPPFHGWNVQFGVQVAQCWLSLYIDGANPRYYFHKTSDFSPPDEYQLFINFYQTPINNWGYGGFATIFWMKKINNIIEYFGMDYATDLMLEMFPTDTEDWVIKLCSHQLRQNVRMRFTP